MSKLAAARDLVRAFPLPDALRDFAIDDDDGFRYWDGRGTFSREGALTADILANSLHPVITLATQRIKDEHAVPLGASKYRGLPHLPPDFRWPDGQYFAAQLNLVELHHLDVAELLPDRGMLYFFFNGGSDATVAHYDGPLDALAVRAYPDPAELPDAEHYLDDFVRSAARFTPTPGYLFYVDQGYGYQTIAELIPADLRAQLDALLCGTLLADNTDLRLFGRPRYWQGEDETYDEHDPTDGEPDLVLFHDEFGEGNIHFRIAERDLRARAFGKAHLTYSGT